MVLITSLQFVLGRVLIRRVLNVPLAVNKVRPDDGKEVVQNLKSDFERIFALLS
jgi:hypothetical protein